LIEPVTKLCAKKTCKRAGRPLLLSEFTVNRLQTDGLNIYCRRCTKQAGRDRRRRDKAARKPSHPERVAKKAMAPVEPPPPTDAERVLAVLADGKRLEFRALARAAQLSHEDLFMLLPQIVGSDKPLMSKNGTAPRVYFRNLSPQPTPRTMTNEERENNPPLSFSTIRFLHPVIGGRR